jgi:methylthioribose-1-phosphate isomerase
MQLKNVTHIDNVRLSDAGDAVILLDQSLLPNETRYLMLSGRDELFEAIRSLRVRGAPAIGIFAAYAVYVLSARSRAADFGAFYDEFTDNKNYLDSSRPTAVNLKKALDRMDGVVLAGQGRPLPEIVEAMKQEALRIHQEDMDMCLAIPSMA